MPTWAIVTLIILAILWAILHTAATLLLSGLASMAIGAGRFKSARQICEKLLRRQGPIAWLIRDYTRFRLAWACMMDGDPAAAATILEKLLERKKQPAFESAIRRRLADALEALGRTEEADAQRKLGSETLDPTATDAGQLVARARILFDERKFSEACDTLERAMEAIPNWNRVLKHEAMGRLALANWEAGRLERALHWAESLMSEECSPASKSVALSTAALAAGGLGKLEKSESYLIRSLDLARKAGNKEREAQCLVSLGEVQRKRGRIVEAMQACEQAAGLSLATRRTARCGQYECLMAWGRFDEAQEMLEQAARAQGQKIPSAERRLQAAIALGMAVVNGERGRLDEALTHLDRAAAELDREERLGLWSRSVRAWLLAKKGDREQAINTLDECSRLAEKLKGSRSSQLTHLSSCGRVWFELEEYARSEDAWSDYLKLDPDPVERPKAHYYLGRCSSASGDDAAAARHYQDAIDTELDVYYTRLSEKRLNELSLQTV